MAERLLSATASQISKMNKLELKQSIKASEGRIIMAENMVIYKPLVDQITSAEIHAGFSADMLLMNFFDLNRPFVNGLETTDDNLFEIKPNEDTIRILKKMTGRVIGLNLEPVDKDANMLEERKDISDGRIATAENFVKANDMGFDFVCITGNPRTGVDNKSILNAIKLAKENFGGLIIAGKMHSAGVDEPIIDLQTVDAFIETGADIILVPSVGTIPEHDDETQKEIVKEAHSKGALVMSSIGTSQESSSAHTLEDIGLRNKICGVDIQHIGDCSSPETIYALSVAIRGTRHTFNRMSLSVNR
ncbi:haloacid dehalogenase-like hydrolase [Virgibacillus halophilus]|uniref:Haloacid dehalogenase-like hydrolase n=1 Tax=Tigheibacillus halophilus TaxID=361280 RepID=A0ABU5C5P8_9BACI|nr:haloacid dehalogenase-like hydrolase [Virgibacillus halophilus]